jgi:hypothetical protein
MFDTINKYQQICELEIWDFTGDEDSCGCFLGYLFKL